MTPFLRKLHKWVGLAVSVQFLLWLASGLAMSLFDHHQVTGASHRKPAQATPVWPANGLLTPGAVLAAAKEPVEVLDSLWLADKPIYRLKNSDATWLVDARTGTRQTVDAGHARAIAEADYSGEGKAQTPLHQKTPSLETRKHPDAVWRVDFDDADATSIYVSAEDGRILERRNATWRLFDIAWMLHIMDYSGREDFNNSLVVTAALAGLWMALSGIWLLCTSVRWHDFVPLRLRPAKQVLVLDERGKRIGQVSAHLGETVFNALARSGIQLPSNCGGGQSCGLCEVRTCGKPSAPSSSDAEHIEPQRLRRGHRLACGLAVQEDMEIAVSHGAALMVSRTAVVERVTAVTPFLREVVLRPDQKAGLDFRPGTYVQLHIPNYKMQADSIHRPQDHHEDWKSVSLPAVLRSKSALRRSYSLSSPPAHSGGCLTLLVRFMPGMPDTGHAPGRGSSYVYSLKPGDRVSFNGPFGEFALRKGRHEKVFIGGGAGMAPLRAMILALLDGGASEPIHFWYGARSGRDIPFKDEFDELARRHPHFSWQVVLSEGQAAEGTEHRGMVHEVAYTQFLSKHPGVRDCDFYVCGPPAMLHATRSMLKELGAERVAFDDFKI